MLTLPIDLACPGHIGRRVASGKNRDRNVNTHHEGIAALTQCGKISTVCIAVAGDKAHCRSEEHTSELQSLMRISYAVFCLKKKKKKNKIKPVNDIQKILK